MRVFTQFTDELKAVWPNHSMPFYTFAWHKAWYEQFGNDEQLTIIEDNGSIIPLSIHDRIAHFTGGEEIADYLDVIGETNWKTILPLLKDRGAQSLHLRNIPEYSKTLSFFPHEQEDTTPILTLPETFDAYIPSLDRKQRHELRRKIRKFENEHIDSTFERISDIDLLISLMQHNPEKLSFLTPPMISFFHTLPNILRTIQFVLRVQTNPVATVLAFPVEQSLLLYNSGYMLEGAGVYIKVKILEWAILNGFTSINFLQGNERYKYDLGAHDACVYRISEPL